MSIRLPKIAVSSVPRPVKTGYGPDRADTVAAGTIAGLVDAGGAPVILPVVDASLAAAQIDGVDGLVLSGGHDLALADPASEAGGERWIDPARDAHEIGLWRAAEDSGVPVLGICRGAQLVNHVRGGVLAPHIDDHDAGESHARNLHEVVVAPGTLLAAACGAGPLFVNTIHHQAVSEPGLGMRVAARASDGLIEAIEAEPGSLWFVGVQWHPELMPGSRAGAGLFEALIAAATAP